MIAQRVPSWGYPFVLGMVFGVGGACSPLASAEKPSGAIPAESVGTPVVDAHLEDAPALASQAPVEEAAVEQRQEKEEEEEEEEQADEPDRKVTGEASPEQITRGADPCPPSPMGACDGEEPERCETHQRVTCQPGCHGYRSQRYVCEQGKWRLRDKHEPTCDCAPKKQLAELAGCSTNYVSVIPSVSYTDGCRLGLRCGGSDLWVECDGENDGTNTSLCECWRDGEQKRMAGSPYPGEGPDACFAAAVACTKAR